MKTIKMTFALLLFGLAAVGSAGPRYRVELRGNSSVLSKDQPSTHGTIVLFHRHPDGHLIGLPQEEVVAITPAQNGRAASRITTASAPGVLVRRRSMQSATTSTSQPAPVTRPLAPGEVLVLGPTGGEGSMTGAPAAGRAAPSPSGDIRARAAIDAQVFPGDLPAPAGAGGAAGAAYGTAATNVPAGVVNTNVAPGSINPTLTGAAGTIPATGAPQAGTQPINPNGFPATTTTGPQSGTQPVDQNGFPSTAQQPQNNGQNPTGQPAQTAQPAQTVQPNNGQGNRASTPRGSGK